MSLCHVTYCFYYYSLNYTHPLTQTLQYMLKYQTLQAITHSHTNLLLLSHFIAGMPPFLCDFSQVNTQTSHSLISQYPFLSLYLYDIFIYTSTDIIC